MIPSTPSPERPLFRLRRWIVLPVAIALVGSMAFGIAFKYRRSMEQPRRQMERLMVQGRTVLRQQAVSEARMLRSHLDYLAADPALLAAWKSRDPDRLVALAAPLAHYLREQFRVTHFYFVEPDRTCFLRAYDPSRRGGRIDQQTMLAAARTGTDAWGLELGSLGTFTLRYVRPWVVDGEQLGYLELGMEIEHLSGELAALLDVELVAVVRKEFLRPEQFEAGRAAFGFSGRWHDFSEFVVAHQSVSELPPTLAARLRMGHEPLAGLLDRKPVRHNDVWWWCGMLHQPDVAGRDVADLILLKDVTGVVVSVRRELLYEIGLGLLLAAGVLALLWSVTGRTERQLAADFTALREREETVSRLIDNSPLAKVISSGPEQKTVLLNRKFTELFGYTIADIPDVAHWWSLACPDPAYRDAVREEWTKRVRAAIETGGGIEPMEATVTCKDGSRRHIEFRFSSVGRQHLGTFVDLTERKRLEEALIAREREFRNLAEGSPDSIIRYDLDHRIVYLNRNLVRKLKLADGSEVIGRRPIEVWPDGRYAVIDAAARRAVATGSQQTVELTWERAPGEIMIAEILVVPERDGNGEIIGTLAVGRDITAVRESGRRLRHFIDNLPGLAFVFHLSSDGHGSFPFISPAIKEIFGLDPDDVRDDMAPMLALAHPDDQPRINAAIMESARAITPFHLEARVCRLDQPESWLDIRATPESQSDGSVLAYGIMLDITEHKRMEEQLAQARKMESIGVLAGGIAHDFNNILTPIMAYSEMALLETAAGAPMRHGLEQISFAAKRAKDLVRQILDFSRRDDQELTPVKMGTLLKEGMKFLRAAIPASIALECRVETTDDMVMADPTRMLQVLMNLTVNAAHAMRDSDGRITVGLGDVDPEETAASAGLDPARCCLKMTVEDTGAGIAAEYLHRVFEPYFTTKDKGEGTGMGLAVAYGIVADHGGAITVRSEEGRGSIFTMFLPRVAAAAAPESAAVTRMPAGGSERILLVDDEPAIIAAVASILEQFGYRVTGFSESPAALAAFQATPDAFDLLITDQTMPRMEGVDLIRAVLALRPGLPVILASGLSEEMDEEKARAMGIGAFVRKPFFPAEFVATIRRLLDDAASQEKTRGEDPGRCGDRT